MQNTADSYISARIRALLNTRGAPLISAADFIQPVISVASWYDQRKPQLEVGDEIPRAFTAEYSQAAVALQQAYSSIRVPGGTGVLIWLRRIAITCPTAVAATFNIGRTTVAPAQSSNGTVSYNDTRLGSNSLIQNPIGCGGGTAATPSTLTRGFTWLSVPANTTVLLDVDYTLDDQGAGAGDVMVVNTAQNVGLYTTYYGIVFPNLR